MLVDKNIIGDHCCLTNLQVVANGLL
jgi:hypothetical protein